MKVVVDGGNGMAGPMVGPILRQARRSTSRRCTSSPTASSPTTSRTRCWRRTGEMIIERVHSDRRRPRDRLGRRRRPLLLHRRQRRVLRRRLHLRPAGPGRPGQEPGRDDPLRPPLQPRRARPGRRRGRPLGPLAASATPSSRRGCARRAPSSAARSPATTTSATSGTPTRARSRRCWCWSCSRSTAAALGELMAEFRSALLHLRRDQLRGRRSGGEDRGDRRALLRRRADPPRRRSRSTTTDWHFNVRPSNTEPLLRLNLESLVSREDMERQRDEVLGLIRA